MTDTALQALEIAKQLVGYAGAWAFDKPIDIGRRSYSEDELTELFDGAIASLKQQPPQFDDIEVFRRINAAVARTGSIAAAAREFGVHKQTLHSILNADRACPPPVLHAIGLRRVPEGRKQYEDVSNAC